MLSLVSFQISNILGSSSLLQAEKRDLGAARDLSIQLTLLMSIKTENAFAAAGLTVDGLLLDILYADQPQCWGSCW